MENKRIAFVIMQIGNSELDKIYSEIFIPVIKSINLEPKRIDQDNEGKLLKKEITDFIERADIIIADLTNERPNCYLEVGYAMGLDKFKNLIFTAREDHLPTSMNYKIDGPKIHFDLSGYDILFWDSLHLEDFKTKLTDRINRRLLIISPRPMETVKPLWDDIWLEQQRKHVSENLKKINYIRRMESLISPVHWNFNLSQGELLEIASASQIQTFGWPIGIVIKDVPELKPIPKSDGIISEINGTVFGDTYDFSYFKKNGQIFISKSLFEERDYKTSIIPEIRIRRVTELLMFTSRFYSRCGLPEKELIKITLKYSGLVNNKLDFANRGAQSVHQRISMESESSSEIETSIADIEVRLPELVNELLKGLFVLFDFYEPNFESLKFIVDNFVTETNKNANR